MHCLFYIACFFLALQAALAVPTVAPRAEQSADAKGQSDQKCWFGCGGYGFGYPLGGFGGVYGLGSLYGGLGLYGGAYLLNPYSSLYGPGWGLWKKDAAAPNQNSSVCLSLSFGFPCKQSHTILTLLPRFFLCRPELSSLNTTHLETSSESLRIPWALPSAPIII